MIEIISATRRTQKDFWENSALGISLLRNGKDPISPIIAFENRLPLPVIYNDCIQNGSSAEHIVFIHDDVWIDDIYFAQRVMEGLTQFDVIGVVGTQRRQPRQASWCFANEKLESSDKTCHSGRLAAGNMPFGNVLNFGHSPAPCVLMDGVFLAASKAALCKSQTFFDPAFAFHFYDMDFCRNVEKNGLRMGTWPISMTHQSNGTYDQAWYNQYLAYLRKWGE